VNGEEDRLAPGVGDSRGPGKEKGRLLDALLSEARLLDRLRDVLSDQRNGVARDDLEAVDESVYAAQRILLTIAEARRRRRSLMQLLGGVADVSLDDLERALGPLMDDEIRRARSELEAAARRLAAELDINRRVLQSAIRTGETYVRALYGAAGEASAYSPDASQNAQAGTGLLLNRQV
jgi:hypothetical protein